MRLVRIAAAAVAAALVTASPAAAKVLITVDKSAQTLTVSVDGEHRWTWPVSTGRLQRDTPAGSFRAFRMERDHYSREWDDAPMPHSIFFTKTGHAIHGSLDVAKIGSPASAGCVRLAPENAAKLFELVEQQGVLNTTVVIAGDVRVAIARTQQRTARTRPSDDDAATPRQREPRVARPQYEELPIEPRVYRTPPRSYAEREYGERLRPYDDRYYDRRYSYERRYYVVPREYDQPRGYYQPYYAPYPSPYYRSY